MKEDEKSIAFSEAMIVDEIQDARKHINQSPKATGFCLYCGESLGFGLRFCDMDCAYDVERFGTIDGGFIPIDKNTRIKRGQRPQYLTRK